MRQKLHDPLSASGLLSLYVFEKKLFVVERWYARVVAFPLGLGTFSNGIAGSLQLS